MGDFYQDGCSSGQNYNNLIFYTIIMSLEFFSKRISLRTDEELVAVVHHHPITYLKQFSITVFILLFDFFLMFYFFSLGSFGVALFLAVLFTGIFYGGREFYIWYLNVFIITTQRIIDLEQSGFLSRTVSEAPYDKIADISYKVKGFSQTVFNLGTIKIKASGVTLVLANIKNVAKVNQIITDLIKEQTGRQIEVKKVKTMITSQAKKQITEDFIKQDDLAEYDEYDLDKLLDAYTETLGELRLKKVLVDQLSAAGYGAGINQSESLESEDQEAVMEPTEPLKSVDSSETSFKKRQL